MPVKTLEKEDWIKMFRDIGLSDTDMANWHRLFEERHPDAHQSFLAWMNISPREIQNIRARSIQL
ncbi:MAG: hypothetical protein HQL65_18910 [Magnetococcales bacterium]|nr:hypothetical protein [Magnetococcales bacterium]